MIYLKKVCVPNRTEDLNLCVFNMITGINNSKTITKHTSCECNVDLMEKNVIQVNGEITIHVDVSVKNVMHVKKIIFGILRHAVEKMENFQQVLWMIRRLRVITLKSHTTKKQIIIKRKQPVTCKISIFYLHFY